MGIFPPSLLVDVISVSGNNFRIAGLGQNKDRINGEPCIAPFTIGGLGSFIFLGCVV